MVRAGPPAATPGGAGAAGASEDGDGPQCSGEQLLRASRWVHPWRALAAGALAELRGEEDQADWWYEEALASLRREGFFLLAAVAAEAAARLAERRASSPEERGEGGGGRQGRRYEEQALAKRAAADRLRREVGYGCD